MTAKASTFAGQLKLFAQLVDIVDTGIFDQVRELVYKYVMNELKGEYFEVLSVETTTGDAARQSSLRTIWSSNERSITGRSAWRTAATRTQ